jgi:SAM-dependent methyltransferase
MSKRTTQQRSRRAPNRTDAYGHQLQAFYDGTATYEIIERDDGLIDVAEGAWIYLGCYADWPAMEREAMRYVRGSVLDIGCGAGRHALYLQACGCDVLGIDSSPGAIGVSRARGLKKARVLAFEAAASLTPRRFDTFLMLGNNFGLCGGWRKARRLLRALQRIAAPDARIIAQSTDPYRTTDPVHLAYQARNRRRGRMGGQNRIRVRYREHVGPWFDYLLASREEMRAIVDGTGWGVRRFITARTAQYIAVLQRAAGKVAGIRCAAR